MSRKNTRRSYTDDFKSQAVALSDSIGRAEAANDPKPSPAAAGGQPARPPLCARRYAPGPGR